MTDLYGVDPAAPATPAELVTLLRMFGPTEGRFIANFPLGWTEAATGALGDATPLELKYAHEWVLHRRRAFINVGLPYVASRRWEENAVAIMKLTRGLIGARGCAPTLTSIDVALMDPNAVPDARGAQVPRTVTAYLGAVWPLLATCSKVVLVDPYFRLRLAGSTPSGKLRVSRQRKFLVDLLTDAERRRKLEFFVLWVSSKVALEDDPAGTKFEEDLERVRRDAGATSINVEYGLLDEDGDSHQHARYLLGQGCGLQFDYGFDPAGRGTNHIHWLSATELAPLLERFDLPDE